MRLIILFLLFITCSCSVIRRNRDKVKTNDEVTTASSTKTEVYEKLDTVIILPGSSVTIDRDIDDLLNKGSFTAKEGPQSIRLSYDGNTRRIRAVAKYSDRYVPIKIDKKTVTESNTDEHRISNSFSKTSSIEKRKPAWMWLVVPLLGITTVGIVIYISKKRKKN